MRPSGRDPGRDQVTLADDVLDGETDIGKGVADPAGDDPDACDTDRRQARAGVIQVVGGEQVFDAVESAVVEDLVDEAEVDGLVAPLVALEQAGPSLHRAPFPRQRPEG